MPASQNTINALKGGDAEHLNIASSGRVYRSAANALTALAGGAQAGTAITTDIARVTTVVTAGDSVQLPASEVGALLFVTNAAAANSMNVFPATGEAINAGANNAAFAVAAGKSAIFACAVVGKWSAVLTA